MDQPTAEAQVELANARYLQSSAQAEADKEALFDACAEAVQAGSTPEQLDSKTAFTAAYIRRKLRERGVAPLRTGPKPKAGA